MMEFTIPKYESAMWKFVEKVIDGFMSNDPLFSSISRELIIHKGPIRNVRGQVPFDQKMVETRCEVPLKRETIRNTDVEKHTEILHELARSSISAITPQFFQGISELANIVGNSMDAHGAPFSFDQLLDLMERMDFRFDDQNEPIMPTLFLGPELHEKIKNLKLKPEQEQRLKDILERKKAEHDANKRTRRLS
jgi:hypothetical protein